MNSFFRIPVLILIALLLSGATSIKTRPRENFPINVEKSKLFIAVGGPGNDARAVFKSWDGKIVLNPWDLLESKIHVIVNTKSLHVANPRNLTALRRPESLAVDKHPKASFMSTQIVPLPEQGVTNEHELNKNNWYQVRGDLHFRGVTRSVSFPAQIIEEDGKILAQGEIPLSPQDFGLKDESKISFDIVTR